MKRRFIVSASYTGECCTGAHLLVSFIKAKSKKAAREIVRKRLKRADWEVGDMVVMGLSEVPVLFKAFEAP